MLENLLRKNVMKNYVEVSTVTIMALVVRAKTRKQTAQKICAQTFWENVHHVLAF